MIAAALCWVLQAAPEGSPQKIHAQPERRIPIHSTRRFSTDLAVTGLLSGLPQGATGYVRYADLTSLPLVSARIVGDENFSELPAKQPIVVTGVPLEALAQALGALSTSDLIDASCTDDYRAHYPASYLTQHHPLFALKIDDLPVARWAKQHGQYDPGPYFITHAQFTPAFKVLAHSDRPQVPTNVIRLDFSTIAETFGAITPRGMFAGNSPQQQGFTIARQNCLRCHNLGRYGGTKAGRTWLTLATWAQEQPAYFESYVREPKSREPMAKMPANPEYDQPTLRALTAYFRTLAPGKSDR